MMAEVETYTAKIRAAFPELTIDSARQFGEGQFNVVVLVNETLVFRFPRSAQGAADLRREVAVLQALRGHPLPVPIPDPVYLADDPDTGALAFMGYVALPGEPLNRAAFAQVDAAIKPTLAHDLGHFLRALHSIPVATPGFEREADGTRESWIGWREAFRDLLYPGMRPDAREMVDANFAVALDDATLWDFAPVLHHGDFGTSNILYHTGRISGVLDFSFCGPGDPAQDLGALIVSYGEAFVEDVYHVYPVLRDGYRRARFIMGNYALFQAYYALKDGDRDSYDDGMADYV